MTRYQKNRSLYGSTEAWVLIPYRSELGWHPITARKFKYDWPIPREWAMPHHKWQQQRHSQSQFMERGFQYALYWPAWYRTVSAFCLHSSWQIVPHTVGVGFSHGTTTVGTSQEAASDVWKVRIPIYHILTVKLSQTLCLVLANFFRRSHVLKICQEWLCDLDRVVWW